MKIYEYQHDYGMLKPQYFERVAVQMFFTLKRLKVVPIDYFKDNRNVSGLAWEHGYRKQRINKASREN